MRTVLGTALVAGLTAGLFVSVVQLFQVTPLILEAETYETGAGHAAAAAGTSHDVDTAAAHSNGEQVWAPQNGLERTAYTVLANILTGFGFGLLLAGCLVLYGRPVDVRQGVLWGMAGFAAFALAPALGLPPEVPGSVAAEVDARQAWWLGTAVATAGGIAVLVFASNRIIKLLGLALILAPHVVGVPHPVGHEAGNVPPELAAQFVVASLFATALFWAVLGGVCGLMYRRLS